MRRDPLDLSDRCTSAEDEEEEEEEEEDVDEGDDEDGNLRLCSLFSTKGLDDLRGLL